MSGNMCDPGVPEGVDTTMALISLLVNFFIPGLGTGIIGCISTNDATEFILLGVFMFILASLFFVGWIWGLIWSFVLYKNIKNAGDQANTGINKIGVTQPPPVAPPGTVVFTRPGSGSVVMTPPPKVIVGGTISSPASPLTPPLQTGVLPAQPAHQVAAPGTIPISHPAVLPPPQPGVQPMIQPGVQPVPMQPLPQQPMQPMPGQVVPPPPPPPMSNPQIILPPPVSNPGMQVPPPPPPPPPGQQPM